MIPRWKVMKGVKSQCPKCHGVFGSDEFDFDEEICLYCLFPESMKHKKAELSYEFGDPVNKTIASVNLEHLSEIPEKMSKAAARNHKAYKEKTYKRTKYPSKSKGL